uniref:CNH domain-containing protein n=1 Tax=Heterorhabditis bacteriophora TaxID=37862 RepID=A0A1I7XK22_HETBA
MFEAYAPNEVAMKLPLEITSITCQKSSDSVLAGSKIGQLFVYSPKRTHRRGFELDTLCKQFERRAVLDLTICEREELLICISDGQVAAHHLGDRHFPVIALLHKTKPVHSFVQWNPKGSDSLYIIVSSKKRLFLFKWTDKDFHDVRFEYNHSFIDKPSTMRVCGSNLVFSVGKEYYIMKLIENSSADGESFVGEVHRLFEFPDSAVIVDIYDRKLLGFCRGDVLVLYNYDGQNTPHIADVRFSEPPLDMVYDTPYLVSLLPKGRIEVRSLNPSLLIQTMVLSKAGAVCGGNPGYVYVSSPNDVWILDAHTNLRKNVSMLIAEKHFDLAIQLVEESNVFTPENKLEIKRQAAVNLFNKRKFEESFALHAEIKSDVITIIQLFPEFLPVKLQKSVPALDFPVRSDYSKQLDQYQRDKAMGQVKMSNEDLKALQISLQVVDTTLLKCYLQLSNFYIHRSVMMKFSLMYIRTILNGLSFSIVFFEIFIGDESDVARNLNRDDVLDFLRFHCIAAVIPYLALVEHYIAKIKMLFQDYVHVFPDAFYEERALILGRLKQHEQVLTLHIYVILLRISSNLLVIQVNLFFYYFVFLSNSILKFYRYICYYFNAFVRYPTDGSLAHFGCYNENPAEKSGVYKQTTHRVTRLWIVHKPVDKQFASITLPTDVLVEMINALRGVALDVELNGESAALIVTHPVVSFFQDIQLSTFYK